MATRELQTLVSVLKNKDISVLFGESVDDLFVSYGDVWAGVKGYYQSHRSIPDIEVMQERFPDLEDVPVKGDTKYYLESLKSEHINNRIERILKGAGSELSPDTAPQILQKLQTSLAKLNRFSHASKDVDIMDTEEAERHYASIREKALAMGGIPGIPTGIGFIDSAVVSGMQGGDIVSVIGYPARGKSALTALLASNAYSKGFKPMIVSLEMTSDSVRDRVYTVMGSGLFRNNELSLGNINTDDLRSFASKFSGNEFIVVTDGEGMGVRPNTVQAKIQQHRPDFVIIDYLQLMSDNAGSQDMTSRMRNLSLELKRVATAEDIPIVVISSATPDNASSTKEPPNVEQTAWSRQLSYDSSLCIAIHRHDGTDIYEIVCAKNRYGPLFAGYLQWDINSGIIEEKYDID